MKNCDTCGNANKFGQCNLGTIAGQCVYLGFAYYVRDENKVNDVNIILCERCSNKTVRKFNRINHDGECDRVGLWCDVCDDYPIIDGRLEADYDQVKYECKKNAEKDAF